MILRSRFVLLAESFILREPARIPKIRSINFSCEFDERCAASGEAQPYYNIRFMAAPNFSCIRALIF